MLAVIVAAVTCVVYLQALDNDFVYDDIPYVLANPHVASFNLQTAKWALLNSYVGNWHPLTWLSHAADVFVFGLENPTGHHATGVILHALSAALLLLLLHRMTGRTWCAAAVAILFALHPIQVESVAWIAQRKNVLSTLFLLLTMHAYMAAVRRPTPLRHVLVIVAYAAAVASKPIVVTLPFVLLLFDYWPLNRLSARAVLEKIPLFALSAATCVITWKAQSGAGAATSLAIISLFERVQNAAVCCVRYLSHAVWPSYLSPFYPYPRLATDPYPFWALPAALVVLVCLTGLALQEARRRPYLITGWLFYLGTLVPVIGLVQVGRQSMADRFAYVSFIGLYIAAVWLVADVLMGRHTDSPRAAAEPPRAGNVRCPPAGGRCHTGTAAASGIIMVLATGLATWRTGLQIDLWQDSETLWRHALKGAPLSPIATRNLGLALAHSGSPRSYREAETRLRDAIRLEIIHTERAVTHYHLGRLLMRQAGRRPDGLKEIENAVLAAPTNADYRKFYANALYEVGRLEQAEQHYLIALELDASVQQQADIRRNYAALLDRTGRSSEAVHECTKAVELDHSAESYTCLGVALRNAGRIPEAIETLKEGLARHPGHAGLGRRLEQLESGNTPPAP